MEVLGGVPKLVLPPGQTFVKATTTTIELELEATSIEVITQFIPCNIFLTSQLQPSPLAR